MRRAESWCREKTSMQHDRRTPDEEEIEPRTGGGSPAMKCHHALRQAATGISSREEINVFPVPLFLVPQAVAGAIRRHGRAVPARSMSAGPGTTSIPSPSNGGGSGDARMYCAMGRRAGAGAPSGATRAAPSSTSRRNAIGFPSEDMRARWPAKVQPLPEVLNHRTFDRMRIDLDRYGIY